jgi:hypothetical protein
MKSKKIRPLSNESLSKKPTSSAKSRQKWWFGILLIVLLIGYLVWRGAAPEANTHSVDNIPVISEQAESTQIASVPLANPVSEVTLNENKYSSDTTNANIPDPKAILKAPLPATDSLAKEEIDRLEDERKRLAEQEKLAAEQIAMTKQLTELKAQEITILEQQIAQLEAEAAKTNAK